jgi:serine/threonine protein kinase/signal transduction histidine kinase
MSNGAAMQNEQAYFLPKGYQPIEKIGDGAHSIVYKAIHIESKKLVAIKIPREKTPDPNLIAALHAEFELMRQLKSPHLVKSLEWITESQNAALVMEYEDLKNLKGYLSTTKLTVDEKIKFAVQMCNGLADLHQFGYLHKDFNPHNILVNHKKNKLKICDFSLSAPTRLSQDSMAENETEGTIGYLAPEQTGRLPLPHGQALDLFSLGAVLYFLFYENECFVGKNLDSSLYKTLALPASLPTEPKENYEKNIWLIIKKCLEKLPENRFQSAQKISMLFTSVFDSSLFEKLYYTTFEPQFKGTICAPKVGEYLFKLAQEKSNSPDPLISNAGVCVVGESGSGKTFALNKLSHYYHKNIQIHIQAKAANQEIPLQLAKDVLIQYIHLLLAHESHIILKWKKSLQQNFSYLINHICNENRVLCRVLGVSPEEMKSSAKLQLDQETSLFEQFFSYLPPLSTKVVFLVDDFQYADTQSQKIFLGLLKKQVQSIQYSDSPYLFLFTVTSTFLKSLQEVDETSSPVYQGQVWILPSWDSEIVLGWIQECFGNMGEHSQWLAIQLNHFGRGNPNKINYLIKELINSDCLVCNERLERWELDVDKSSQRLSLLNETQSDSSIQAPMDPNLVQFIQKCCILGNQFNLSELIQFCNSEPTEIQKNLRMAMELRLIKLIKGNSLMGWLSQDLLAGTEGPFPDIRFQFVQDTFPKTLISSFSLENQREVERFLRWKWTDFDQHSLIEQEHILDLMCSHPSLDLQRGFDHILEKATSWVENMISQRWYEKSYHWTNRLIENFKNRLHHPESTLFTLQLLHLKAGAVLLWNAPKAFEETAAQLIQPLKDAQKLTSIYIVLSEYYIKRSQFKSSIHALLKALAINHVNIPAQPNKAMVAKELILLKYFLRNTTPSQLVQLPEITDPSAIIQLDLLTKILSPSYFESPALFSLAVFKMLRITKIHGMSMAGCFSMSVMGVLEAAAFSNSSKGFEWSSLGLDRARTLPSSPILSRVLMTHGMSVWHWCRPMSLALPFFAEGIKISLQHNDYEYFTLNASGYVANAFMSSSPFTHLHQESMHYLQMCQQFLESSHIKILECFNSVLSLATQSQPPTENPGILLEKQLPGQRGNSSINNQELTLSTIIHMCSAFCSFHFGYHSESKSYAKQAYRNLESLLGTGYQPFLTFYYGVTLCTLNQSATKEERSITKKCLEKLKKFARFSPENYEHRVLILEALISGQTQQNWVALELLERASQTAAKQGFLLEEALAQEQLGYLFIQLGQKRLGAKNLHLACTTYERLGFVSKSAQLLVTLGISIQPESSDQEAPENKRESVVSGKTLTITHSKRPLTSSFHPRLNGSSRTPEWDTKTLFKSFEAMQQARSEAHLIQETLQVLAQSTGATRASILLVDPVTDEWEVKGNWDVSQLQTHILPLEKDLKSAEIPWELVHYLSNTLESILLENIAEHPQWSQLPYLKASSVQSLIAIAVLQSSTLGDSQASPLKTDSKYGLTGILYLECKGNKHYFSEKDEQTAKIIAHQLSLSINNARVMQNLEKIVQNRTVELSSAMEQLQQTRKELVAAERLASLGELVAGVAHEINTPLGVGVLVASTVSHQVNEFELKIQTGLKKSDLQGFMDQLRQAMGLLGANLQIVTSQVEQFKSLAQGSAPESFTVFSLLDLLNQVKSGLSIIGGLGEHELLIDCDPELVVQSHKEALMQICYNLLKNTVHHAFPKGTKGRILFTAICTDGVITLACNDNGVGIPKDVIPKIFDPFFSMERKQGNMGLGLHIVHNLASTQLRGRISVQSEVGVGTVFTLEFPQFLNEVAK